MPILFLMLLHSEVAIFSGRHLLELSCVLCDANICNTTRAASHLRRPPSQYHARRDAPLSQFLIFALNTIPTSDMLISLLLVPHHMHMYSCLPHTTWTSVHLSFLLNDLSILLLSRLKLTATFHSSTWARKRKKKKTHAPDQGRLPFSLVGLPAPLPTPRPVHAVSLLPQPNSSAFKFRQLSMTPEVSFVPSLPSCGAP